MNRESVINALQATTVPEEEKKATLFLKECAKQQGFLPALLNIIADGAVPDPVRQSAAIYFKMSTCKLWEGEEEDELSEEDRGVVKAIILRTMCEATEPPRIQLAVALSNILRADFPDKWHNFMDQLFVNISNPANASVLSAGLLALYTLAKRYEFKRTKEKDVIAGPISRIEPLVFYHCNQWLNNQSAEAVVIKKQGLKIIYVLTQFSIHFSMLSVERLDDWIKFSISILSQECPAEIDSIEDKDERAQTVWWKCKKWAVKLLDRMFDRHGSPNQVPLSYVTFAKHFLSTWTAPILEIVMVLLNAQRNNVFVSERVLHHAISFTNTAVTHSYCWRIVKPHALDLIRNVLFPLMCYTEEDEEMWNDNVEEFIRFKFDIFEDLHSPVYEAGALLRSLAKRKDIVQPVLAFAINILSRSTNPREIEGALRMIGELDSQLTKSKKYKGDVERMLDTLCTSRLKDSNKFVKARAAWCFRQYSDAQFRTPSILSKIINTLVGCLCDQNEELPVKVEAALAIQCLLKNQEKAHAMLQPSVKIIIVQVLELVAKTQVDDVVRVVDELLEHFLDTIVPIAADIAESLTNVFLQICTSPDANEQTHALMSILPTLSNILDVVENHREVMVKVEPSVLKIVQFVINERRSDFYCDALLLMQSLLTSYVSEPMWSTFNDLYELYKSCDHRLDLPFADIFHALHLYLVTDTESFLAFPERLQAFIDMCKISLQDDEDGDENHLFAAKLMESILLQCSPGSTVLIAPVIPTMIMLVLQRLTKPVGEGMSELKPLLLLVVVAAIYSCHEVALRALAEIAPNHPKPLDYVCDQLLSCNKDITGVHNRKMALFGICAFLSLPYDLRPTVINVNPQKVIEVSISIFDKLEKALKAQADTRNEEAESEESETESDDYADPKQKKGSHHRSVPEYLSDGDDEIDEFTFDYIDAMAKENKIDDGPDVDEYSEEDEESSTYDEADSEQFQTRFDEEGAPDVFVCFKNTMERFEQAEPELFAKMVSNLTPQQTESLHKLIKTCEQHLKSELSRRLERAGGYNFMEAVSVPSEFNFAK